MTSTVRAAASAPLSLPHSSPESLTDSSPSPSQETHRVASGVTSRPSQPAAPGPHPPLQEPVGIEIETSPWSQVHPALIDQLVSFEAQIGPPPMVGGYIYGQTDSPHTSSQIPFPSPLSSRPVSPSRLAYPHRQTPRGHLSLPPHDAQYSEGSSPISAISSDASAIDARWGAPLRTADMHPQFARPRTPPLPDSRARDPVLRQSGSLTLTEAWSQFVTQMDIPPVAPQRLS